MSTAIPQVPPRPTRAHEQSTATGSGSTSLGSDMPRIPPRPGNRRIDRSISPSRESFARSPLNETSFLANHGGQSRTSLYSTGSANASSSDLPARPSSVVLPSIGQEGSEYAEVFGTPEEFGTSPTQTRNVADDLKLHAPRPSLPTSSAKARVSAVTRTDSGQAAAFGIGKASSSDDRDPASRDLKTKSSFASQASNSTERRPSSIESDHGIPEIGQRVPMYPNAGDVQAPSPSPFAQPYAPGVGFHNDGSKPRHHGRRTSARGNSDLPLEVYGKHGHGLALAPHDRFEKAYYEKHPELAKKEIEYHEKPEWAMSSDDLNKIVRDTASRASGLGASAMIGTPTEQIGFQAAEEYASRMSSPRPQFALPNTSDTSAESSLRKESFPTDEHAKSEFVGTLSRSLHAPSDVALSESEVEGEDTIHVDAPERRISRILGGAGRLDSTEDLGPNSINDEEYGAPILASDEVAKEPFGWELQPAVSPVNERRGSAYDESGHQLRSGSVSSLDRSRPSSRPGSIHGTIPGLRMPESTPLEDLDEYEPLFPEEEKAGTAAKKPSTAADKLKRPMNRKFPSQDIWEDTPNSLQYTATVSTPQLPEDSEESKVVTAEETPEQAFARRQEDLAEQEAEDSESFLNRETKPWAHTPHVVEETRPGLKQRFPSRDIWEDTPDSLQLQTTVATPQSPEKDHMSQPEERPTTGAVTYHQDKAAAGIPLASDEGRATTGIAAVLKPQVPARPVRSKPADSAEKPQPAVPERPLRIRQSDVVSPSLPLKSKPQVPARPSKLLPRGSSENVLTQVASNSSVKSVGSDQGVSAIAAKPKPPVPSRPLGSKIAALQGGFMSDLNKRLQLGPQAPKKEETVPEAPEEEKEKVPLVDARKGRARGPARRAPAKSPAPVSDVAAQQPSTLGFFVPSTCWQIDPEEDLLHVASHEENVIPIPETKVTQSEAPTLTTNAAGDEVNEASEITPSAEKLASAASATEDIQAEKSEVGGKEALSSSSPEDELEPAKPSEDPLVSQPTSVPEGDDAGDLSTSTATLKPEEVVE